jgi:hypothetical protein
MWRNPDNFDHLTEVSVAVRTISEGGKFFASGQLSFGRTQTFWWAFGGPLAGRPTGRSIKTHTWDSTSYVRRAQMSRTSQCLRQWAKLCMQSGLQSYSSALNMYPTFIATCRHKPKITSPSGDRTEHVQAMRLSFVTQKISMVWWWFEMAMAKASTIRKLDSNSCPERFQSRADP